MLILRPVSDIAATCETNDELRAWRDDLERNIRDWRAQYRGLALEAKSKERMLAIAQASSLKAGKYKGVRNRDGSPFDVHAGVTNDLKLKLVELETNMEALGVAIAVAREELADLPEPEASPGGGAE